MRGRKVKTCYQCSKGNNAEIFSNEIRKKKDIRYSRKTLIYNVLLYIFKLVFIIFFLLYRKLIKNLQQKQMEKVAEYQECQETQGNSIKKGWTKSI